MSMSRRSVIKLAGVSFANVLMPELVLASKKSVDWHTMILSRLAALSDKPAQLNCLLPNGSQANLNPLKKILAEKTGIELVFSVTPVDDINTQLFLSKGKGGQSYDLALPATFGLPDLAAGGVIQPLDVFAKRYEPEDFHKDALYTLGDHFDGKLYGYQTDGDAYMMFFNQNWLDNPDNRKRYEDTHAEVLKLPETWETLDKQMKFFHNPGVGHYGGALFRTPDYLAWEWWARFHAKGYYPLTDTLEPQIDNDAGVAALEELIIASSYLSPESRTNGLFENWRQYGQGNCYCNIGWGGTQKYLNSAESKIRGQLKFSPLPGGVISGKVVRIPYFNWGWNYTVPSNARYPEAAYLCALLAVTPHISTLAVRENGYFDPFRESHYKDSGIQSTYSPEFLAAHKQSMKESIPDLYLVGSMKYMTALKTYLHRAEKGEISPRKALQAAANAWRVLNRRYGVEYQLQRWKSVKQQYPEKLMALLK